MSFAWTDSAVERAQRLQAQGLSMSEIGAALGTTKGTVIGKLRRVKEGVEGRAAFDWTAERIAKMREMRAEGWSAALIAAEIGATKNQVIGRLVKEGIPAPKRVAYVDGRGMAAEPKRKHHAYSIARNRRSPTADEAKSQSQAQSRRRRFIAGLDLPSDGLAPFGTQHVCQFPMWPDDRKPGNISELIICGRGRREGESWCSAHCRLVYLPETGRAP